MASLWSDDGGWTMTLQQLYDELQRHDWFYHMSDDNRAYTAGAANAARLVLEAAAIPGGAQLMSAYQRHAMSGEPWTKEKHPKPERPA